MAIERITRGSDVENGLSETSCVYREFLGVLSLSLSLDVPPFKIRLGARVYLTSGKSTYESRAGPARWRGR